MTIVSLENIKTIFAADCIYDDVLNVEIVYRTGNQFLQFSYIPFGAGTRQTACVNSNSIQKLYYRNTTPELKIQAEVLEAYKEGRLVGY